MKPPAGDKLAFREAEDTFADSEKHSLLVRKYAAVGTGLLIVLLYAAGVALICGSVWFSNALCGPAAHEKNKAAAAAKAASASLRAASEARPEEAMTRERKRQAAKLAKGSKDAEAEAESAPTKNDASESHVTEDCGDALALFNSHALVAAFIALFSIPTVMLIVLFRAFASGKKESPVPDTVASWIGEKAVALAEKALGGGKD